MKTIVYVDGFNLYYGALKDTPYKWLDIPALCQILLPTHDVVQIKYFTARIHSRPTDPDQSARQYVYLRALQTQGIQLIFGHYLSHVCSMFRAVCPVGENPFVKVIRTEEKGTDVNIASHMLLDAAKDAMDCAVLISGDSDLKTPVSLLLSHFHKSVGVLNPQKQDCYALKTGARFYKRIREAHLQRAQLPPVLQDASGQFHKPSGW